MLRDSVVERVADATEHRRGTARAQTAVGLLLPTDRRKLAQQRFLSRVEPSRGLHQDRDDEVTTTAAQPGHAATAERVLRVGLGARLDLEVERRLQAGAGA